MIKHIVMWNLSGETAEAKNQAANHVKARFESLAGRIPGLLHIEIGIDVSKASYACDVVLYSEFDSQASLAAYADHPAHLDIRNELKDVRIARYQVDYIPEKPAASPLLQPWSESVAARK